MNNTRSIQDTFREVLNLKLKFIELTKKYQNLGYSKEKATERARFPKMEAYKLLLKLKFNGKQAVEFFKNVEYPTFPKWYEDIFFDWYDVIGRVFVTPRTREWCKLPYPKHPQGCPNYRKKDECPPHAPMISDFIDLQKPHFFAIHAFDLTAFSERMKQEHPTWSDKKSKCPRYWQNHVESMLERKIKRKIKLNEIYTFRPEAMGGNIFRTLLSFGFPIRPNPQEIVFKVGLIGTPFNNSQLSLDDFRGEAHE